MCFDCSKPVHSYASPSEYLTSDAVAAIGTVRFGRVLCLDCIRLNKPLPRKRGRKPKPDALHPSGFETNAKQSASKEVVSV